MILVMHLDQTNPLFTPVMNQLWSRTLWRVCHCLVLSSEQIVMVLIWNAVQRLLWMCKQSSLGTPECA